VSGFLIAHVFNRGDISSGNRLLQNVFIGVVLTATSVSITVETLRELGKLDTRVGSAILGAALIDDILGILALTVITSSTGGGAGIGLVLLRILLFFAFVAVTGFAFYKLFMRLIKLFKKDLRRFAVVAFVFCLLMAYCAEEFFGVADITGAYIAGLIICNTQKTKYIASRFDTLSFLLLSPIFFASIGIEVVLPQMSGNIILFTVLLLIVSILTKIVGCGLGAKACGYPGKESLQIGLGMIPRGEVTLIIAQKGVALGVMNTAFYGPIIIMVVVTAIVTPVLFKLAVGRQEGTDKYAGIVESPLVDWYRETEQFDLAQQVLLELHESLKGNSEDSEDKPN
jgi:Kef-type K+ transport system membrane component KefB